MIQVSRAGENCIVLFGGTNQLITRGQAEETLAHFCAGDVLLLQNEISAMQDIMKIASERGMQIYLNPAPMNDNARALPLELVDTLVVNETEGASLVGIDNCDDASAIISALYSEYPKCNLLLTLGARGSCRFDAASGEFVEVAACHVDNVVDTTAAGDTFIGYYLAGVAANMAPADAMQRASRASAICVSRAGAGVSIPQVSEL